MTSVFYDSAYKVVSIQNPIFKVRTHRCSIKLKSAWDIILDAESNDGAVIDVESWWVFPCLQNVTGSLSGP